MPIKGIYFLIYLFFYLFLSLNTLFVYLLRIFSWFEGNGKNVGGTKKGGGRTKGGPTYVEFVPQHARWSSKCHAYRDVGPKPVLRWWTYEEPESSDILYCAGLRLSCGRFDVSLVARGTLFSLFFPLFSPCFVFFFNFLYFSTQTFFSYFLSRILKYRYQV